MGTDVAGAAGHENSHGVQPARSSVGRWAYLRRPAHRAPVTAVTPERPVQPQVAAPRQPQVAPWTDHRRPRSGGPPTPQDESPDDEQPGGFDRWRQESAIGEVGTSIAKGLRNVFAPTQQEVVIVASVPGDPPDADQQPPGRPRPRRPHQVGGHLPRSRAHTRAPARRRPGPGVRGRGPRPHPAPAPDQD